MSNETETEELLNRIRKLETINRELNQKLLVSPKVNIQKVWLVTNVAREILALPDQTTAHGEYVFVRIEGAFLKARAAEEYVKNLPHQQMEVIHDRECLCERNIVETDINV